ncbi:MAG: hypothetical protein AB9882_09570 [Ignavibacteriaceae bacterium]
MKKIYILLFLIFFTCTSFSTIRYVSKTGTSTPPYTSWETASDSIQKCLDICIDGDTVIVANGVYKESLIINASITFIGSSMDSCVIDGRERELYTIDVRNTVSISGFRIYGKGNVIEAISIIQSEMNKNISVINCVISGSGTGIDTYMSNGLLHNLIIKDILRRGISTWCASDYCTPRLTNSVIIVDNNANAHAWYSSTGGSPTLLNNILLTKDEQPSNSSGVASGNEKSLTIKNNLFGGFIYSIRTKNGIDSGNIFNNIFKDKKRTSFGVFSEANSAVRIRNNIFLNNSKVFGLTYSQPDMNYNIFWENEQNIDPPFLLGGHDTIANPMFIKDTLASSMAWDFHLQMYSPGKDVGDPSILDRDSTRSDIGMYGGPGGEIYQYLDLPPQTPRNIKYTALINERKIIFTWKKNSESDFKEYHVFRDTVQGFVPDSCNLYLTLPDSILEDTAKFIDTYTGENVKYYYRITAADNQENESSPSDEISVIITGVDIIDIEIVTDYRLYQNYPNPFNPNTVIGYQLAVGSYVKVIVYDIKGELLEVLVNENKTAGYYEVEFNAVKYASGIFLYRIEAVDESGIPRFMDMKKMMLVK